MSIQITFPFDNSNNYSFDSSKIEVSGGEGKLILANLTGQSFIQDFANDTGFTYDSDLAEFVAGQVQQKDTRPTNATFYASFNTDANGNWGGGNLSGTLSGGASVSGGQLDCTSSINDNVIFDAAGNADFTQTGTIRFRITPNYSGAPASSGFLISSNGGNNEIHIVHLGSGNIRVTFKDTTGTTQIQQALGSWSPVSGTLYEFELNFDLTAGETRLFIDGTQFGSTITTTMTRNAATDWYVGTYSNGAAGIDAYYDAIMFFDAVQHTANYTPDWSNIYENIYVSSVVTLPTFTYSGLGAIQSFDGFTTTESSGPHYTVNGQYWNGSAWINSNDTYNQANSETIINANISTLPASNTLDIKIIFNDSDTQQGMVDNLNTEYTGQAYSQDDPQLSVNTTIRGDSLISFVETATKTGSDEIKYILNQNGTDLWFNGVDFVASNGTYSESNTAAELQALLPADADVATTYTIKMFFHSDDGSTTPAIDSLSITYDIAGPARDDIFLCEIYFDSAQIDGEVFSESVTVTAENSNVYYKGSLLVLNETKTLTPDVEGRYTVDLIETVNMSKTKEGFEQVYVLTVGSETFRFHVPEENTSNLFDNLA